MGSQLGRVVCHHSPLDAGRCLHREVEGLAEAPGQTERLGRGNVLGNANRPREQIQAAGGVRIVGSQSVEHGSSGAMTGKSGRRLDKADGDGAVAVFRTLNCVIWAIEMHQVAPLGAVHLQPGLEFHTAVCGGERLSVVAEAIGDEFETAAGGKLPWGPGENAVVLLEVGAELVFTENMPCPPLVSSIS